MSATPVRDEAHWHELRARHIGGSEIAALFGLSPFQTAFTLWHHKAGRVVAPELDSAKLRWGKMLEPLIAHELGRALGWTLEASRVYWTHGSVEGLGCTLDFDVLDHQWGPGIVETKVVFDYADYKRDWSDLRAPPNYELQVQHQLLCTGREWCAIVAWVAQTATLAPALIRRPAPGVTGQIEDRVGAFWRSIAEDRPPEPSGTEAELSILREIWPERAERKVVEIADRTLGDAAQQYLWAAEMLPGLERERTARKVQLLAAAKDAALLRVPDYDVAIRQNKRGAITLDVRAADNGVVAQAAPSTLTAG